MPASKLVYLATPYSLYETGINMAFIDASRLVADMMKSNISCDTFVYSPIVYTHPVATFGNIDPLNHEIWLAADAMMMDRADELWIATTMCGWNTSYGVSKEFEFFRNCDKPIFFLTKPDEFELIDRMSFLGQQLEESIVI
jgi:hypothetical protein